MLTHTFLYLDLHYIRLQKLDGVSDRKHLDDPICGSSVRRCSPWNDISRTSASRERPHLPEFQGNPTWRKRRSALERGLAIIAVCGVLLHTASARSFGDNVLKLRSCNSTDADICTSPACIHTASNLLKNMNRTVDPCDDFYRFSCGGFLNTVIIPEDKATVSVFVFLDDQLLEQLRRIMEDPSLAESIHPFRLTRTLYKSCMNRSAIEDQGLTPLLSILKKLGGWPVLDGDTWRDDDFSWISSVYKFRDMGFSEDYFLQLYVAEHLKNNTRKMINLGVAELGLPRESALKGLQDKTVKEYYRYMVDMAVILGVERERAEQELMESLEFEMKLENMTLPMENWRDVNLFYNPMTVAQLSKKYPSIPWKEFINTMLKPHTQVDDDEIINVDAPSFISDFEQLIESTPKRVQANYVMWRAVAASVTYLNDEVRKRQLEYWTTLTGQTKREILPIECVSWVVEKLPVSVGALYVRKYFHKDVKKNVVEMISDIRNQFKKILQTVDWMDEKTRKSAVEKAVAIASNVGYPDELLDDSKLEEFYEKLQLRENASYLENNLDVNLFKTEYSFSELRKPVNKSHWVSYADVAVIGANYFARGNTMSFTAGILQDSLFSIDRPKYMNYGAFGPVIGHEITHGFDDGGRQFDKDGNVVNWWAPSTEKEYLQKVDCVINQYGNYTVKEIGKKVDGIMTQGENIADIGGIKTAYLAYKEWADQNKLEPMLPGLPYSPKQMFWISAANVLCSMSRPEELERMILDPHSPSEFRVRGPMSNLQEFANDFNCPTDSRMNPQHKCVVW